MKRTRRHKFLQISVFVLVWSIIKVYSDSPDADPAEETPRVAETGEAKAAPTQQPKKPLLFKGKDFLDEAGHKSHKFSSKAMDSSEPAPPTELPKKPLLFKGKDFLDKAGHSSHKFSSNSDGSSVPGAEGTEGKENPAESSTGTSTTKGHLDKIPLVLPPIGNKNANTTANSTTAAPEIECIPPAIQQFPKPLMGPRARKRGGLILHVIVAAYTFLGLAIVCDEYFVASLDRICEEMKMSPDVAGATFMAAGSSAPELATVVIGVFFAKDDIGISGVIGSAVFNIMFVISVCALCSGTVAYLNWWPLVRDSFFYALSILVMLITIYNKKITWVESLFMLLMYGVYCVALHFNTRLEQWAQTWNVPFKKIIPSEQSGLVTYKTLEEDGKYNSYGVTSPDKTQDSMEQGFENQFSGAALNEASQVPPAQPPPPPQPIVQDYYRPKEYNPENSVDPLVKPVDATTYQTVSWVVVFPIHYMCRKTMPNVREEKYKNWYPFTFFISMVWISFYSYFMVWMITIIGTTMGIPDTVMGLTFVAAGVSVPDALSSIAVIREGYGDMAVSNAIGSNVFDILVCLGLPWFIKTAIIKPGSEVGVYSKGLTYSTLSLLSTVVFLVVAVHYNGWKLDRRFGVILMVWYLVFITFASMYELNVFGYLNPIECDSDY